MGTSSHTRALGRARVFLPAGGPRAAALRLERRHALPGGPHEHLVGYGVMGLTFASGDVLTLRRMVASSIGPPFTSVWHRDRRGAWTMYVDVEPMRSCPRYFGAGVARAVVTDIRLRWTGTRELCVTVPAGRVEWGIRLGNHLATAALGWVGALIPPPLWSAPSLLDTLSAAAGPLLGAGRVRLAGTTPNGQWFRMRPRRLWRVNASAALLDGRDVGPVHHPHAQARLGDFWIPTAGLFAMGETAFEPRDAHRHAPFAGEVLRR